MIQLMYFLLLHSTFVKDKLALPTANSLWTNESGLGESEFMEFQAACVELLEWVCRAKVLANGRLIYLLAMDLFHISRWSLGNVMPTDIMLDESSVTYFHLCPDWTASMQTPQQRNSGKLNKEVRKGTKVVVIVIINTILT